MKKLFLLFVAYVVAMLGYAQDAPTVVEGDLNKDGITDRIVANLNHSGENFSFYFGNAKGDYTLFRSYELDLYGDVDISITDKGVARIQKGSKGDCDVFLFRYQDGDFRCIGGKEDRHNTWHYDVSYNYLTGKMIRTDGEGKEKKSVTSVMPPMPVLRFGWFPLDYNALGYLFGEDDSEEGVAFKTTMGIFRMMQDQQLLFYSFCEYGYPYYPPDYSDDGSASFYLEVMSYGRYNCWSNVSISKQDDSSYLIEVNEELEDRSYELYLNEDMDNLDEAMERAEAERGGESPYSTTKTEWLFKDGTFILLDEIISNE